jgi:TRAP-type mannitol/chloroaromatic compound transport system substrate-binding protein
MMHLVVNLDQWAKLPKSYQVILQHACEFANNWMIAKYDTVNAPALKRLMAGGAQLKPFPQPVLEACHKAAQEYYAELAGQNLLFKRGLDSLVAYRGDQLLWWQIAEHSFDSFMISMRNKG